VAICLLILRLPRFLNIIYQDFNNLYGKALMQKLPFKDFSWNLSKWDEEKQIRT
jgi:hypothetical protein